MHQQKTHKMWESAKGRHPWVCCDSSQIDLLPLQEKYGGFLNKQFQDDFVYYADAVFKHLGPFVQNWMTFNEPLSICQLGYADAVFAPGLKGGPAGQFACGHNLLLAHAKTYQLYRMKYADKQGGRISMALDGKWGIPYDPNSAAGRLWESYFRKIWPQVQMSNKHKSIQVSHVSLYAAPCLD